VLKRGTGCAVVIVALVVHVGAIDLDVTPLDVERALAIARSRDRERAVFHAPYVQELNSPTVERVEIVSEFRRIVRTAEDRLLKGDRSLPYSVTLAQQANAPWRQRLAIVARLRFHPQNTYVNAPPADIVLDRRAVEPIGVLIDPILSVPSGMPGERLPVMGALVEAVFDAAVVGQGTQEFIVRLEGRELARVTFDLGALQ
jgi:hypothetical protein